MEKSSEKLERVVNLLRGAKPVLGSTDDIEREVIKRLSASHKRAIVISDIIDFIFGWVYVAWVRKSLITASFILVGFFVWQQVLLIRQVNFLSTLPVLIEGETRTFQTDLTGNKHVLYKLYGRSITDQSVTISRRQMDTLLETVNDLQVKYKDLIEMIEENPELKKYFENRLSDINRTKIKL